MKSIARNHNEEENLYLNNNSDNTSNDESDYSDSDVNGGNNFNVKDNDSGDKSARKELDDTSDDDSDNKPDGKELDSSDDDLDDTSDNDSNNKDDSSDDSSDDDSDNKDDGKELDSISDDDDFPYLKNIDISKHKDVDSLHANPFYKDDDENEDENGDLDSADKSYSDLDSDSNLKSKDVVDNESLLDDVENKLSDINDNLVNKTFKHENELIERYQNLIQKLQNIENKLGEHDSIIKQSDNINNITIERLKDGLRTLEEKIMSQGRNLSDKISEVREEFSIKLNQLSTLINTINIPTNISPNTNNQQLLQEIVSKFETLSNNVDNLISVKLQPVKQEQANLKEQIKNIVDSTIERSLPDLETLKTTDSKVISESVLQNLNDKVNVMKFEILDEIEKKTKDNLKLDNIIERLEKLEKNKSIKKTIKKRKKIKKTIKKREKIKRNIRKKRKVVKRKREKVTEKVRRLQKLLRSAKGKINYALFKLKQKGGSKNYNSYLKQDLAKILKKYDVDTKNKTKKEMIILLKLINHFKNSNITTKKQLTIFASNFGINEKLKKDILSKLKIKLHL